MSTKPFLVRSLIAWGFTFILGLPIALLISNWYPGVWVISLVTGAVTYLAGFYLASQIIEEEG